MWTHVGRLLQGHDDLLEVRSPRPAPPCATTPTCCAIASHWANYNEEPRQEVKVFLPDEVSKPKPLYPLCQRQDGRSANPFKRLPNACQHERMHCAVSCCLVGGDRRKAQSIEMPTIRR